MGTEPMAILKLLTLTFLLVKALMQECGIELHINDIIFNTTTWQVIYV